MQNQCKETHGNLAVVSIRVLDRGKSEVINNILSKYDDIILARLGLPKSKCDSLILVVVKDVKDTDLLIKEFDKIKDFVKVKHFKV